MKKLWEKTQEIAANFTLKLVSVQVVCVVAFERILNGRNLVKAM